MQEIWLPIPKFENEYAVSNTGIIKSIYRLVKSGTSNYKPVKEKIKTQQLSANGYLSVNLFIKQKATKMLIHRAVALAFIPNPKNKPQVNHIDGNKLNNNVSNLEWSTGSENMIHAYKNNLQSPLRGELASNSKLTENEVLKIRELYKNGTIQKDIAIMFNIDRRLIGKIVHRQRWKHI